MMQRYAPAADEKMRSAGGKMKNMATEVWRNMAYPEAKAAAGGHPRTAAG
jgi:hypothetical protein